MRFLWTSVLVAACGLGAAAKEPLDPARDWKRSTPEAEHMDARALESLDREFAEGRHGFVDSMFVARHGRLVFERRYDHDYAARFDPKRDGAPGIYNYYDPAWHPYYKGTDLHSMQSVSKSVTSLAIGIAIGRGEIRGVDAPALELLPGFKGNGDERQKRMKLRDVLSMTTGIRWDEDSVPYTDPGNSCARMEASSDWVQFVLDQPMAETPGTTFVYSSGNTQLLSAMIKAAAGRTVDEYLREHLFGPLGIERFYWKLTPTGLPDTEGGLYLTAGDFAKLGQLMLQDGEWQGRRVLPKGWVAESVTRRIGVVADEKRAYDYGYQWWLIPESKERPRAVVALGYGGQVLVVIPSLDVVAAFTGWNIWERPEFSAHVALDRLAAAARGR